MLKKTNDKNTLSLNIAEIYMLLLVKYCHPIVDIVMYIHGVYAYTCMSVTKALLYLYIEVCKCYSNICRLDKYCLKATWIPEKNDIVYSHKSLLVQDENISMYMYLYYCLHICCKLQYRYAHHLIHSLILLTLLKFQRQWSFFWPHCHINYLGHYQIFMQAHAERWDHSVNNRL